MPALIGALVAIGAFIALLVRRATRAGEPEPLDMQDDVSDDVR